MTDFAALHPWEATLVLSDSQLESMTSIERHHRMAFLTKGKASYGHMAQAIQYNKDNRLIQVYHSVFIQDYEANEDSLTNGRPLIPQAIYSHCHMEAIGTGCVHHHLVKFTRCSFNRTTHYIEYGSCTRCYRALPMGTPCQPCFDRGHTRRGVRIYFVATPQTYQPPPNIGGEQQRKEHQYQLLQDSGREYCNPIELAHQLHGQEITASLSWNRYAGEDDHGDYNYTVSESRQFQIMSITRLIINLKEQNRHMHLLNVGCLYDYEKALYISTTVSSNEIEANVDDIMATMPDFYTRRQKVLIQQNRAIRHFPRSLFQEE